MSNTSWASIASSAGKFGAKFPELCAAQWALESAFGSKPSGKNNFFGLKGKGTKKTTTEFINGNEIQIVDEFIDFTSPDECVKYLVDRWYKDYAGRYKGVNNADTRDDAARMLVSEKYATDPAYAEKLIKLMNSNSVPAVKAVPLKAIKLKDAVVNFKDLKHQNEAWDWLQNNLTDEQLLGFATRYRKMTDIKKPIKFPLSAPYFYQRDSKTGHGERSCQASAIAMVIKYLKPNLIKDDDDYLNMVLRYGDTVSQSAHHKALDNLGIKNKFITNGSEKDLLKILDSGCPVPVGILHKGNVNNPTGGGHYVTLLGYDQTYFYVHDPFGELDVINGTYVKAGPTDGRMQKYTRKNLMKRWLINSSSDGWLWDLRGND
jgi:hypothetical protein